MLTGCLTEECNKIQSRLLLYYEHYWKSTTNYLHSHFELTFQRTSFVQGERVTGRLLCHLFSVTEFYYFMHMKQTQQSKKDTENRQKNVPFGSFLIFDENVPITYIDSNGNSQKVTFHFRILKKRLLDSLQELNFSVYIDTDIFFLIHSRFNQTEFYNLRDEQKTRSNLEQFGYEIIKIIRMSQKEDSEYKLTCKEMTNENETSEWIMTFIQTIDLKTIEILSLKFEEAPEEERYNHAKSMIKEMRQKLQSKDTEELLFSNTVKANDPVLFELYFNKKK